MINQCADVTFTDATLSSSDYSANCQNSTGVSASYITNTPPNGTTGTTSASGTASSSSSKAWAAQKTVAPFVLGAMGLIGGLAAL